MHGILCTMVGGQWAETTEEWEGTLDKMQDVPGSGQGPQGGRERRSWKKYLGGSPHKVRVLCVGVEVRGAKRRQGRGLGLCVPLTVGRRWRQSLIRGRGEEQIWGR